MLLDADLLRAHLEATMGTLQQVRERESEGSDVGYVSPTSIKCAGAITFAEKLLADLPKFAVDLDGPSRHNVRNTDPAEAHAAASNTFGRSKSRRKVYLALQEMGTGTQEEIGAKVIEMFPDTQAPPYSLQRRVSDLADRGLARKTGEKRRTNAGKLADVWELVSA